MANDPKRKLADELRIVEGYLRGGRHRSSADVVAKAIAVLDKYDTMTPGSCSDEPHLCEGHEG